MRTSYPKAQSGRTQQKWKMHRTRGRSIFRPAPVYIIVRFRLLLLRRKAGGMARRRGTVAGRRLGQIAAAGLTREGGGFRPGLVLEQGLEQTALVAKFVRPLHAPALGDRILRACGIRHAPGAGLATHFEFSRR